MNDKPWTADERIALAQYQLHAAIANYHVEAAYQCARELYRLLVYYGKLEKVQ